MKRTTILHEIHKTYKLPPTIKQLLARPLPSQTTALDAHATSQDKESVVASSVTVNGWIKSIRKQKRVSFATVSDGSTSAGLQAVLQSSIVPKDLTNGASVRLTGRLEKSRGAGQEKDFIVEEVEVLGACDPETYPIQKQSLTNEFLRENVHLRGRTSSIAAMLRLRHALQKGLDVYFEEQGFTYVNTPILTSNDAEGAGETFKIAKVKPDASLDSESSSSPSPSPSTTTTTTAATTTTTKAPPLEEEFFGNPAHLTVSSQLHLEALQAAIGRVWTLSPCFRAERSQTSRHLAEFWMCEAEWADLSVGGATNADAAATTPTNDGVQGICTVVEGMLKTVIQNLLRENEDEVIGGGGGPHRTELEKFVSEEKYGPWKRMSYAEAIVRLQEEYARQLQGSSTLFEYPPEYGKSLQSEHERWLAEVHVQGPVFVFNYPASLKPFYMKLNETRGEGGSREEEVACFDLLVPGVGELVGGSVREERVDVLVRRMLETGMISTKPGFDAKELLSSQEAELDLDKLDLGSYAWYVDLRRYGGAPHVGFGMGFERLVGWVGGIDNVRECVPIPRWAGRMNL
ncbi:asparaginyl-tRNA synthetase [Dendrothele bispora CBS 962.96]|uniref:asparagine--tRNA ligase n=1 Tax=Dendrothele bispora (strain CBS 962.96) TaxID=1314807 RepID=A0A4V4HFD6_DENBC|nr:asparaginyl-tRNA synthetase [Dendrothele bispora CBS 962.96]